MGNIQLEHRRIKQLCYYAFPFKARIPIKSADAVSRYTRTDLCCVVGALVEGTVKRSKRRVQAHSQCTARGEP